MQSTLSGLVFNRAGADRLAAGVAASVATLIELRQGALRLCQPRLQRFSDADFRQPADRLDRPVADALAEPWALSSSGRCAKAVICALLLSRRVSSSRRTPSGSRSLGENVIRVHYPDWRKPIASVSAAGAGRPRLSITSCMSVGAIVVIAAETSST
jgi:hypothetical protein